MARRPYHLLGRCPPSRACPVALTVRTRRRSDAAEAAHLRGPHLRVPDERARLRAVGRAARGRRIRRAPTAGEDADVIVLNTCAVRENADNKLYGNLGHLRRSRRARPGMQIAVGGCLAQKDRGEIVRAGAVGRRRVRHPQHRLAAGAAGAGPAQRGGRRSRSWSRWRSFPSTLPTRRESPTRLGRRSASAATTPARSASCRACAARRRTAGPATILAEVEALVAEGVLEVTLLGQNVNSYGVEFGDRWRVRQAAARLRDVDGLERVRFTSPHPRDFTDDVIAAMARHPNVMPPAAHAAAVRLGPGAEGDAALLPPGAVPRHPRPGAAAMPDAAITTDIIVGFPGETEEDFEADAARRPRRRGSRRRSRSSTPSGRARRRRRCPTRCRRRSSRSATSGWWRWRRSPGRRTARRSAARSRCWSPRARAARTPPPHRMSGRARDNRLVHFPARGRRRPAPPRRPGDGRGDLRRPAPPGRRRTVARTSGPPGPVTCGRRARREPPTLRSLLERRPGCCSGCRPSAADAGFPAPQGAGARLSERTCQPVPGNPGAGPSGAPSQPAAIIATAYSRPPLPGRYSGNVPGRWKLWPLPR